MVVETIFVEPSSFWGISLAIVGGILLVVFILGLCACQKLKTSSPLDGVLVEENGNAITNQPTSTKTCGNGAATLSQLDADLAKLKVPTLQRKLPDIPVLPVSLINDTSENATETQSPDTGSELYATVDASAKNVPINPSPNQSTNTLPQDGKGAAENASPEPSTSFHKPASQPTPDALTRQIGETTQSSGDSDAEHPYSHIQPHSYLRLKQTDHPYDWLKGQTSEERDTDTDNYDDPHVYTQSREWTNPSNEPPPPPVPEKRYDLDNNASDAQMPTQLTAANAVSGRVSASEIPYVTSPVESPTHPPPIPVARPISPVIEPQYNGSETSNGSGPNVRYTSISVREPLANLRAQAQPQSVQQESYYAVVSDDDIDQTYAEIHAGQTTSSDSPAYAAVEFNTNNRELPPVPPPVESLRSLRSTHSGQDSASSTFSGNFTDSAHFTSAAAATNETSSGSSFTDGTDLYSTIEKRRNYDRSADRKTIHTSVPHSYLHLDNVEDMYAKVLKSKRLSLHQDFASSDGLPSNVTSAKHKVPSDLPLPFPLQLEDARLWSLSNNRRPRSMIAFGSSSRYHENSLAASSSAHDVTDCRAAETAGFDPGYEVVHQADANVGSAAGCDPGYESIREKFIGSNFDPGYETVKGSAEFDAGDEPGYETVMLTSLCNDALDPTYETVNIRTVNHMEPSYEAVGVNRLDPGYEQIRKNYVDNDLGYETIASAGNELSNQPGYETFNIAIDEMGESGYEQINLTGRPTVEPGYEHINLTGNPVFVEPGYEQIIPTGDPAFLEPGYEQINPRILKPDLCSDYNLTKFNNTGMNGHCTHDEVPFRYEDDAAANDPGYEEVNFHASTRPTKQDGFTKTENEIIADNPQITTSEKEENFDCEAAQTSNDLKINHATLNYVYNPCYDLEDNPMDLSVDEELETEAEPPYAVVNKNVTKIMENKSDMQTVDVTNNEDTT